ncbi:MAG: hypothetical protein HOY79_39865 [Streptomyces sp.]|nr:hypothetical protein [Streptomyces sp.]
MTDTNHLVVWLRATLDAAERDVKDSGEEPWRAVNTPIGPEVHVGDDDDVDGKWSREGLGVDAAYRCDDSDDDCADARHGYLAEARLIAQHANPAAVLRRIDRTRQILADCTRVLDNDHYGDTAYLAEDTILNLAGSWGWTEETSVQ